MKTHNLLASIAAVLITSTTLGVVSKNYTADFHPTPAAVINGIKVTDLPAVQVRPSAEDMRAASLLSDASITGIATLPGLGRGMTSEAGQFSLIGSQLAMPYYSFGNKFGRISKE
ncbi:MAG TPA: hypothetical protein VGC19_04355 [Rhodanobacter sp.]